MMKCKIRTLCLTVQICCLLIGSGLDMAVLCYAEDDHAQIEAANAEGCAPLLNHDHTEDRAKGPQTQLAPNDNCGDCLDVPLSIGRAEARKKPLNENLSTSIVLAPPSNCNVDSESRRFLPQLILPPPDIGPLSSTVLLI